ncbi:MAG: hemerythrin family protein [Hyphomicrobiaceae bacterium]|nr:hemerythrin family protein [Hyphomicrobiaceae bacterium]
MSGPSIILGIPLMDEDHAVLESLLMQAAAIDDAGLQDLLDHIEAETRAHFRREEDLMREAALTVLPCHMMQHEMFLAQFRHGYMPLKQGDLIGVRSFLIDKLPAIFSRHINTADRVAAGMLMTSRTQNLSCSSTVGTARY